MSKDYTEFDHSDDNEDDDDDIGALGSILSWDEDDNGVVGTTSVTTSQADPTEGTSTLPDLVSFSHMKDKDSDLSYLQQPFVGGNETGDPATANLPLPTRINYQSVANHDPSAQESQEAQKLEDDRSSNGAKQKNVISNNPSAKQRSHEEALINPPSAPRQTQTEALNNAPSAQQQQAQLQQQQQQIRLQQQQIQQQQQQIQQHQLQQQLGIQQQQQRIQQQMATSTPAPVQTQTSQQALTAQSSSQPQQSRVVTQQAQLQAAPGSIPPNLQGALSLLQQNALLAQQNAMVMPSTAQTTGQEKSTDQQPLQQQTTAQFIDPNTILRRLQVAQLQQQFNVVQAQAAQVQAQAALQQRIHYPGQVQMVPSSVPSVSMVSAAASVQSGVSTVKNANKGVTRKPVPRTQTSEQTIKTIATKTHLVSASDTDGEVPLKQSSTSEKKFSNIRKKNEIDISNMTSEQRQKANRDRNREHARNTRLRKKQYLETLKSTVNDLCQERDTLVTERAGAASILVEMNNTRTEVLMSFFALRSANEKRRQLWSSILDESCFTCALPVTPYRSFPASEVQVSKCQRTILGIDGMMSDTASLHVLLNTLVDRSRFPTAAIAFRYTLVTEEAVVAGNQMMARWVMQTLNATQFGARMEVSKQGMLCCKFNSSHKIVGLELMFDVMALMLQLKQAAGSDTFSVIPNTVQTCQRSFDTPMVMILADEPYTIMQVNKLWENMSGYKAAEVVGRISCRVLEGEQTDMNAVEIFMNEVRFKRPTSAMIVHYKKSGERFKNFFLAYPLSTDSRITHYLIFTSHVGPVVDRSDGSSNNTTVLDDQQLVLADNTSATMQSGVSQSNFITQNLRANFNAAQRQAAVSITLPNSQSQLTLPPILSNPLPVAPPVSILSPNLSSSQNSSNFLPQQFHLNTSKRPNESLNSLDVSSRKQPKTHLAVDAVSSVD